MRRVARIALLAGIALVCAPAQAAIFLYAASLSGDQESPPVVSPGTGFTAVTYDDVLHTLRVQATFSGLTGTTTASHIHVRPDLFTPNGGVATQVPTFLGFPLGVTSGIYDSTFDLTLASSWNPAFITANGGTTAGAEAAFFAALDGGRSYLNVHSSFAPGGEIRGDLAAVPEPMTWTLMIMGFGLIGAVMRRWSRRTEAVEFT